MRLSSRERVPRAHRDRLTLRDHPIIVAVPRGRRTAGHCSDVDSRPIASNENSTPPRQLEHAIGHVRVAVTQAESDGTFFLDVRRGVRSTQEGPFLRSGGASQLGHDVAERNGGMLDWIAGVALYERALDEEEIGRLLAATSATAASRNPSM
jgi:hypothetical protein